MAGISQFRTGYRVNWGKVARWPGYMRMAVGVTLFLVLALPWLAMPAHWGARRGLAVMAWRLLLRSFGIKVVVHGAPMPAAGTLYVANHISWTDIPVLGLVTRAAFVAKDDIRGWPVIGRLTTEYGCVFVERERRGRAAAQAAELASHLEAERGLVLFPEGTTGLGDGVLPFRSSLFALVPGIGEGTARVQPITLRYTHGDGTAFSPQDQRRIAWIGDDELLPHALHLAGMGRIRAEVWFEEPIEAGDRKALARACEASIVARLGRGAEA